MSHADTSDSEQQLSAIEQEYRQRLEAEFMRELEEESKRVREEMRKTLVSQEERYVTRPMSIVMCYNSIYTRCIAYLSAILNSARSCRRQIEDEFAAKLETQARILEQHYNTQLAEALASQGRRSTGNRSNVSSTGNIEAAMNQRYELSLCLL